MPDKPSFRDLVVEKAPGYVGHDAMGRWGFATGAEWARQETIREVLELLRSEEAPKEIEPYYPYNQSWARWLEEKLK